MGVYARGTRAKKFFKRRPKKGGKRLNNRNAKMSDLYRLSKQVSNSREPNMAFVTDRVSFGGYLAPNQGVTSTWRTLSLAIDGGNGISIPQNATISGRVGQNIDIKKGTLKMQFLVKPVDAVTNPLPSPQVVQVMFGYSKPQVNIGRQALPTSALDFYRYGGSSSSPTGSILDYCKTVNNSLYTICKKSRKMKLGNSAYYQSQTQIQDYNNNNFSMYKSYTVDLTKHYIKTQKFNEFDLGSSCRGLYAYIVCAAADGTFSTQLPLECAYELCVQYQDS